MPPWTDSPYVVVPAGVSYETMRANDGREIAVVRYDTSNAIDYGSGAPDWLDNVTMETVAAMRERHERRLAAFEAGLQWVGFYNGEPIVPVYEPPREILVTPLAQPVRRYDFGDE